MVGPMQLPVLFPTFRSRLAQLGWSGIAAHAFSHGVAYVIVLTALTIGGLHGDQHHPSDALLYPICELTNAGQDLQPVSQVAALETNYGQVQKPYIGIWITAGELAALPTSGPAWDALKAAADKDPGKPDLQDQNQNNDVYVMAKALVYARTGETKYRDETIANLMQVIGTERGGRTLALGRNLSPYIIAVDLINLPAIPDKDRAFRRWLLEVLDEKLGGRTLRSTQEDRPNNWGNHAGASRAAIAIYLGNYDELERTATVFRGYLGDRSAYSGFRYGVDLSWQCDEANPVGINPKGCVKEGYSIDGALPEEMRRGGPFHFPPTVTGYAWEGMQGAVVLAEILTRAGYPAWEWQDQALLRSAKFLYSIGWTPKTDDEWQVWVINHAYHTDFSAALPAHYGKNMGWTDWTHSLTGQTTKNVVGRDMRCR